MTKLQRIEAILNALAIVASEFGPFFIHSAEGQATLKTGVQAVQILSSVVPAIAETAPVAA